MKKGNILEKGNKKAIDDLQNKLWTATKYLRHEPLETEEYYFLLYLLTLTKEDITKGILHFDHFFIKDEFINILEGCEDTTLKQLFFSFQDVIGRISNDALFGIFEIMNSLDREVLRSNFSKIFDDLLFKIARSQGRYGGEIIQPAELTNFIARLINTQETKTVYNPFAGLASFGVSLDSGMGYFGQEVNEKTWSIGSLRLLAYGRLEFSNFELGNSIENWDPFLGEYDLIVAHPPFGARIPRHSMAGNGLSQNAEGFLVENGLDSLNPNGRLISVMSNSFLFSNTSRSKALKQDLVERDWLETIISFPGGLMSNANIPFALVVINKNKKDKGFVQFIDASQNVHKENSKELKLDSDSLFKRIKSAQGDESFKLVSNEKIENLNFDLSVQQYLMRNISGVALGSIAKALRFPRLQSLSTEQIDGLPPFSIKEGKGKFVRIRDLKDDNIDYDLNIENIEESTIPQHAFMVNQSCLLIASRWKSLKPTYFHFSGQPIFLTPDIYALVLDQNLVDVAFLINELHADYIGEQIVAYRRGTTVPVIRKPDVLKIKIKLPEFHNQKNFELSINEQRAKVAGLKELSSKVASLEQKISDLNQGKEVKEFDEFASLKHTLGAPRQNILSYSESLINFFDKNKSNSINEVRSLFKNEMGEDLLSIFKTIRTDITFISELLEKGENGLILSDYKNQVEPIKDIHKILKSSGKKAYKFKIEVLPLQADDTAQIGIKLNTTLFQILLDNLMSNADKHGFSSKNKENRVVIDPKVIDDIYVIEIKNNGASFPKNFDKKKFAAKYSTADTKNGKGLGGYDINRIVEYFEAKWDLYLNQDTLFPVSFRFEFPIILTK